MTAGGVHELLREAYRALPRDRRARAASRRPPGLRPTTPDNLPLIGPARSTGSSWRPATSATGSCSRPLTAERIAALLTGEPRRGGGRDDHRANGERVELGRRADGRRGGRATGAEPERRGVAVAVDGEVVPRSAWEQHRLTEGQRVEVVGAIQGG